MKGNYDPEDDAGPRSFGADEALRAEHFATSALEREDLAPEPPSASPASVDPPSIVDAREHNIAPVIQPSAAAPTAGGGLLWLVVVLALVVAGGIVLARR